jgi:hypothetical protein
MGTFSIWHWIIVVLVAGIVFVFPAIVGYRIAQRAGFQPWWGALLGFPLFGLVVMWMLALRDWPVVGHPKGQRLVEPHISSRP